MTASAYGNSSSPQAMDTKGTYAFPYLESGVSLLCGLLLGMIILLLACCSVKRKRKRIIPQRPLNTELYRNFDNCLIELRRVQPPEDVALREEPRAARKPQGRKTARRVQLNKMTQTSITRPYSFVKFTTKDSSTQTSWKQRNGSQDDGNLSESHQQLGNILLQTILQHSRVIYGIKKISEDKGEIIPIIDDRSFDNYITGLKQQQFLESTQPSSSTSSYVLPEVLNTLRKPPPNTQSEGEDENYYVNTETLRKKNKGEVASNTEDHTYVNYDRSGGNVSSLYTRANPPDILDMMNVILPRNPEIESHFMLLKLTEELLTLYPEQDEEYMSMDGKNSEENL